MKKPKRRKPKRQNPDQTVDLGPLVPPREQLTKAVLAERNKNLCQQLDHYRYLVQEYEQKLKKERETWKSEKSNRELELREHAMRSAGQMIEAICKMACGQRF